MKFIKGIIKRMRSNINVFKAKHLYKASIGKFVKINHKCKFTNKTIVLDHANFNGMTICGNGKVVIGRYFHSGENIRVITSFHNYKSNISIPYDNQVINKDVIINDNVWIGDSVIILGGVTIGEGSIIQAGSVVCKDIPPLSICGGHPAVPFGMRNEKIYYSLKKEERFF